MNYYTFRIILIIIIIIPLIISLKKKELTINYKVLTKYTLVIYVFFLLIPFDYLYLSKLNSIDFIKYIKPYTNILNIEERSNMVYIVYQQSDSQDLSIGAYLKGSKYPKIILNKFKHTKDATVIYEHLSSNNTTFIVIEPKEKGKKLDISDNLNSKIITYESQEKDYYTIIINNEQEYTLEINGETIKI